ncbi:hypothetical protein FEM48_Zijuj05G0114300 [Ziziphus jujuba var. spinosa]|uniref:Uncharacterized protein n=1 Tax=Ziziphus jujuba var. spinosa TaxID=714518 RepID=A0A978VEP0_ZIZJJ|nr:hypothetical protein FEM48_Zijuj05G0114300 [Ziziphus jujuba var. spinosa]
MDCLESSKIPSPPQNVQNPCRENGEERDSLKVPERVEVKSHGKRILGKNPRVYDLLRHAAIKNHAARSSSSNILPWKIIGKEDRSVSIDFDAGVEETIVCTSSSNDVEGLKKYCYGAEKLQEQNKLCALSFGSSKVYSSVVVAPSFSASSQCQSWIQES